MKTTPCLLLIALISSAGLAGREQIAAPIVGRAGSPTLNAQDAAATPTPATDSDYPEKGMVPEKRMLHIGIVVRDIARAREAWVKYLGLEKTPDIVIASGDEKNPTEYRGHPSTATAKLVFMTLDSMDPDGFFNYALVVGTVEEPTDAAPNGGYLTTGRLVGY